MIQTFYILAWFLLIGSAMVAAFMGTLSDFAMVTFGLVALALVYSLMLWSVVINEPVTQSEK